MPSPLVVYDACVLFPPALRDLLLRLAAAGLVRARWSERILDEVFDNLRARRPDLEAGRLLRTRRLMCEAIPECVVRGYERLVPGLFLPDPSDRHVLATAIHGKAGIIVTANLRDFPAERLAPHGVAAQHPDDFVLGLLERADKAVLRVLEEQAGALRSPPLSVEDLMERLARSGLARAMARVEQLRRPG